MDFLSKINYQPLESVVQKTKTCCEWHSAVTQKPTEQCVARVRSIPEARTCLVKWHTCASANPECWEYEEIISDGPEAAKVFCVNLNASAAKIRHSDKCTKRFLVMSGTLLRQCAASRPE